MRAMVLERPRPAEEGPLEPVDGELTQPGPGELLLRVVACAVCRTDLHVVDGELPEPKLPLIPGHEIVGTVVERGPGADRFAIGDRVGVPWLGWTCGVCPQCVAIREGRALEDAAAGKIETIYIWKFDRLGRNLRDFLNQFDKLGRLGTEVESVTQPLPKGPVGRMLMQMLGSFAELDRANILETLANVKPAEQIVAETKDGIVGTSCSILLEHSFTRPTEPP